MKLNHRIKIFVIGLIVSVSFVSTSLGWAQGVNQSANTAVTENKKAANQNISLGATLIAIGTAMPFRTGCFLIYLGVTMVKQGEKQRESARGAQLTAQDSAFDSKKFEAYIDKDAEKALADAQAYLDQQGYKLDLKDMVVEGPNGKFNLRDLSRNAADMAAKTGFSPEDIEKALAEFDKVVEEKSKKVASQDTSKLVPKVPTSVPPPTRVGEGIVGFDWLRSQKSKRKPADVAMSGLVKYMGTDPVGISKDDIFIMIQRRYQQKNNEGFFRQ